VTDGYCDVHCHLLHGLDDGAKSAADTLEMARLLTSLGFTHCAPSPHARAEYAQRELAVARLGEVQQLLAQENIALTLSVNAENYFLEPTFLPQVESGQVRCMGQGKYVLVEAPYSAPVPTLKDLIFRMAIKGYTAVIAHPERCLEFERKQSAQDAVGAGALLQLDLGALAGRYGNTARKMAESFLGEGLYAVAATDLHSAVRSRDWLERSLRSLIQSVGQPAADALLNHNPRAILRGDPVPGV